MRPRQGETFTMTELNAVEWKYNNTPQVRLWIWMQNVLYFIGFVAAYRCLYIDMFLCFPA